MIDSKPTILGKFLPALKSSFRATFFRTCWYSDNHEELDRIFRTLKDPWNFETSPYERERFALLLDEVRKYPHASILEVGCAEGLFTGMLTTLAKDIVAIDVSPTAIARARERHAGPEFIATSLDDLLPGRRFDLVVCAETLYYIRDVAGAIEKLSTLGRWCIVSYLRRESKRLDAFIQAIPSVEFREIRVGTGVSSGTMIIAAWQNPDGEAKSAK
jgi:2-polyprenyl-3-methyl-5-hydroxy-6-metoxy-1,4-benzoquinol methylase